MKQNVHPQTELATTAAEEEDQKAVRVRHIQWICLTCVSN